MLQLSGEAMKIPAIEAQPGDLYYVESESEYYKVRSIKPNGIYLVFDVKNYTFYVRPEAEVTILRDN